MCYKIEKYGPNGSVSNGPQGLLRRKPWANQLWGHMAQRKAIEDEKTQRQKFIDAARELGADGDAEAFRRAVRKVASVRPQKAKKAARKSKG